MRGTKPQYEYNEYKPVPSASYDDPYPLAAVETGSGSSPSRSTREGNALEELGQWIALLGGLFIIVAIAWAQTHQGTLPPIPPHACPANKIARYHGDNKVHCDEAPAAPQIAR